MLLHPPTAPLIANLALQANTVTLGVSLSILVFAKMVSSVYLGPLHRPLISISTLKNQRPTEDVLLDTNALVVRSNRRLVLLEPTTPILDKVNATYVHEVSIVRELHLVVLVVYAMKATFVEREK